MNKYLFVIGVLLVLIFAGIAYTGFMLVSYTNNDRVSARHDVAITFDKDTSSFVPQVLSVTEGDTVYVQFINEDAVSHGVAIDMYGVATYAPAKSTVFLPPFVATKEGRFIFYCPASGETHLSEVGTLVVLPFAK